MSVRTTGEPETVPAVAEKEAVLTAAEPEAVSSESSPAESKGLFSRRRAVEHPAEKILVDYRPGLERTVHEGIKSDAHNLSKDLGWGRSGVGFRSLKVQKHPVLDDGYVFELQLHGDGGSYLEQVVEHFRNPDTRRVWIPLKKGYWAYIQQSNGHLEACTTELSPEPEAVILNTKDKPRGVKPLYVENYAYFYVSVLLFMAAVASVAVANLYKNVWYNHTKTIVNKQYYTPAKYMPIDTLRSETSDTQARMLSVRYNKAKGWHFVKESRDETEITIYHQQVTVSGEKKDLVPIKSVPLEPEVLSDDSAENATNATEDNAHAG